MSATSHLLLEQANRSVRLGARQTQALGILIGPIAIAYFVWQPRPLGWILASLITGLGLLLFVYGYRLRTLRFTAQGVEGLDLTTPMHWNTIVDATLMRDSLRLRDHLGRVVSVKIVFLTSQSSVVRAIRYHLPPEVVLLKWPLGQPVTMGEPPARGVRH